MFYFLGIRLFSGSHCIAFSGTIVFDTVLSALGGAAYFKKSDVCTPEGAIRPAFPGENLWEQAHPLWCFLTAGDPLACKSDLLVCDYRDFMIIINIASIAIFEYQSNRT